MGMPNYLVLVRHGESEGNVANRLSRAGDNSAFDELFRRRHSSSFCLTTRGISQAVAAGNWIRENLPIQFDRCYASEYIRAMETAAFLGLSPEYRWYLEYHLREREWGKLDNLPDDERKNVFARDLEDRGKSLFFWRPPGGESLADVCTNRADRFLNTLHREMDSKNAIVVCHGEIMDAIIFRIEHLHAFNFDDYYQDRKRKIENGQVVVYSRVDPLSGEQAPYLNWRRSVCPWAQKDIGEGCWEQVERKTFTTQELLAATHIVRIQHGQIRP